ncbi:PREDICTED: protein FAM83H [Nanorana parkeri]|uniref:protein FAM83H n=1 Tax=Nanorana parkeri TaxID=125878 RepID=UPI0008547C8F|nr:PREDICTED: protein FAM83H [Nanorana parkeri]
MARRSQSSSQGDNPLDPNYLPPHYKEYYRIAIDVLTEEGPTGYERFLTDEGAPDFLCPSEVDHISKNLLRPPEPTQESMYTDSVYNPQDDDGSSGTYWPMHSDTAAPELDLGWPTIFGFQGTEVTTLIHPPPAESPTIKEEVRRMIRSAQQVIAIVMDIFTDVDILSDLLDAAARRVPVYIILDHMNSEHFLDMAAKCRVNLNLVEFLRVRTLAGPTYFCRNGTTFKGNLLEKFILVDCSVVLSGTYSFMWSFEKIHRSMAHIFQGELVSSFDEEFRVLFAQSDPLIPPESVLLNMEKPFMGMVPFAGPRPFFERKMQFMFPRDDSSQNSFNSFGVDPDRHFLHGFRREEMMRQAMENPGMRMHGQGGARFPDQQLSFMQNKQLEMDAFKRHSFAEGTFENYSASKQYSRQMYTNTDNNEYRFQSSSQFQKSQFVQMDRPGRTQGLFEKIRGSRGLQDTEEMDSRFPPFRALQGEGNFPVEGPHTRLGYNPSNSSREVRHGSDQVVLGDEGRFGQRSQSRQKFMCQISPTHKQGTEQRHFFHDQDADKKDQENKQGLRSWRISSYLSGIQPDNDEEGMPLAIDSEPFDDTTVERPSMINPYETLVKYSVDPIPAYKPVTAINDVPMLSETSKEISVLEKEKEDTFLSRHDSFRTRTNPLIQRSSRLRSSLIFSNSKVEQHSSTVEAMQSVQKEQSTAEIVRDNEIVKKSSKVAEILEKYRSVNKDGETTAVTQTKAAAAVIQEESEDGQKKSTETVAFKSLESKLTDKDSFSRTLLESQYRSSFTSQFQDLYSKEKVTSSFTKIEQEMSSFQTTESNIPALPEKRESGPIITEVVDPPKLPEIEPPKPKNLASSGLSFGNALESMSQNPTPVQPTSPATSLPKSEEELSKAETPMEFIRKGSLRLKQFLQSKAEKKADEDLSSDAVKVEKQNSALRRFSKTEITESAPGVDAEDKTTKVISASPPKTSSSSQSRLSSSTSNVIFSSNLRDDTKVILEQISANSQKNRAEMAKQSQTLSTNDSEVTSPITNSTETKAEESPTHDLSTLSRSGSFLSRSRFSRPSPTSPEDRDNLLRRMESIRKEKRVYSRFEVFCKKDEEADDDPKDKKGGKFMPKLLGSLIKK